MKSLTVLNIISNCHYEYLDLPSRRSQPFIIKFGFVFLRMFTVYNKIWNYYHVYLDLTKRWSPRFRKICTCHHGNIHHLLEHMIMPSWKYWMLTNKIWPVSIGSSVFITKFELVFLKIWECRNGDLDNAQKIIWSWHRESSDHP